MFIYEEDGKLKFSFSNTKESDLSIGLEGDIVQVNVGSTVVEGERVNPDEVLVNTEEEFISALSESSAIKLNADIDITQKVVVTSDVTLNMNGKKIFNTTDIWNTSTYCYALLTVDGGNLTIKGNGSFEAKENDCFCINIVNNGSVLVKDGTFNGNISALQCDLGNLVIEGGDFNIQQKDTKKGSAFLLNCIDAHYKDGTAVIQVKGGTFYDWNPAANAAESSGDTTNFVAEGYESIEESEGIYKVIKG